MDDRWDGGPCASLGGPISRDFQAAHALGGFAVGLHSLGKTWLRDCFKGNARAIQRIHTRPWSSSEEGAKISEICPSLIERRSSAAFALALHE